MYFNGWALQNYLHPNTMRAYTEHAVDERLVFSDSARKRWTSPFPFSPTSQYFLNFSAEAVFETKIGKHF